MKILRLKYFATFHVAYYNVYLLFVRQTLHASPVPCPVLTKLEHANLLLLYYFGMKMPDVMLLNDFKEIIEVW